MNIRDRNVDSEWVSMWNWNVGLIKINTFNLITNIWTVGWKNPPHIRTVALPNNRSNYWKDYFFPSGRDSIGIGSKIRLRFLFLSYCTDKASFQNCLWGNFKTSPILFYMGGFFGIITSRCEATGLTWSNMEIISSRYVIW